MPSFRTGTVTAVLDERPAIQRVEVDGRRAYVLTELIGTVAIGDRVVVNTTAVDLDLGTGGWDVVHWNLARSEWSQQGPGHIMKLRYTSLQADTGAGEEDGPFPDDLGWRPVVACTLHSQVPCVAATFKRAHPGARVVYVMTDSAALPIALSDLVTHMRGAGLVDGTVTAGHAFGGDVEAVTTASAMAMAVPRGGANLVVVAPGPGVVGTGTRLGHSGVDTAAALDQAAKLGGTSIIAVRHSSSDTRERHRGISHHTSDALSLSHAPVTVPIPRGEHFEPGGGHEVVEVDVPDVAALLEERSLRVTTMGRGPRDDPSFFQWAGAAGVVAAGG